jgi:hypothetical protein
MPLLYRACSTARAVLQMYDARLSEAPMLQQRRAWHAM